MDHATSADGTTIAFQSIGTGLPVVIVGGAFSTAAAAEQHAARLAAVGFLGVTVDRRARGESGDTRPYDPRREVEDIAAVLDAVGGRGAVLGHSSGAVLALYAAAEGVPIEHLFLSEPPFGFGDGRVAEDLPERLQRLVDEGRPDDAVTTFQLEGVGLPEPMVQQIRESPIFPGLVAVAQSTVYDATLTRLLSTPTESMLAVSTPTTILRGAQTFPILVTAFDRLTEAMPQAEAVVLTETRDHSLDPEETARIVAERLR